ncbi:magnesium/cobalt transporter CorA [Rhodospirillaceae bacterium SYSU D60014]|uniref:magnesium/cobalt transporter CorA n=1 Tax=Virgifigura deserti TaxID=2268457 RepID=UPI000E6694F2
MDMVIDCAAYKDGRRIASPELDQIGEIVRSAEHFVWVGLHEPDADLLRKVQAQFGLHDLAIEDAHRAHQRPKIEVYGDSLFVVMRTAQLVDGKILFGETHIFVGRNYVVTVRHGPSISHAELRSRCESTPRLLKKGSDFVLYAVMDFIVDNYFPIVDALEAKVDVIEDSVFEASFESDDVKRVHDLRRRLLTLRRAVSPLLEMCNRLARFDLPLIDKEMRPYFRDVHDHAIRVNEGIDALRDELTVALEANLHLASVRQNEVMKKLAGWAAILAVPTAIAGIYGMNFVFMPELEWRFGYPVTIAVIVGICGYLYYRFRRSGWL